MMIEIILAIPYYLVRMLLQSYLMVVSVVLAVIRWNSFHDTWTKIMTRHQDNCRDIFG